MDMNTCGSLSATMPSGDVWASGATTEARMVSAGLVYSASSDFRCLPTNQTSCTAGANIGKLESDLGIVSQISAAVAGDKTTLAYVAPDSGGCSADISADGTTWTRTADSGGDVQRSISWTGLLPGTTYQYRLLCYYDQTQPWFAFPSDSSDINTSGTFITATPAAALITTTSLANGQTGVPYSAVLAAVGGTTPYSWQLVSGTLPAGLTLNAQTGQIGGTPTSGVTNTPLTFKVTDSTTPAAQTATVSLTLTIASSTLTITTTSLANGQTGVPYSAVLAAVGGTTPYTWTLTSDSDSLRFHVCDRGDARASVCFGAQSPGNPMPPRTSRRMPAGLTLNAQTGQISGIPTSGTNALLTFSVTDSTTPTAQTATVSFTLTIR
jgi:hypothetical protein